MRSGEPGGGDDPRGDGPRRHDRPDDPWVRRFPMAVTGLLVLAVVARWLAAVALAGNDLGLVGGDGLYYLRAAQGFATTGEFGIYANGVVVPDVLHPPLWTVYLGVAYRVGLTSVDQLRVATGLLGLLTVVLVALAGRRLWSARVGILAGAVAALSPAFWAYELNLNAEAVMYPLIALTILLAYRYHDHPTLARALALSAIVGVLALARSEQILIAALVIAPLVLTTPGLDIERRLIRLAGCALVVLAVIAPWTVYNLGRFEQPVILSAGGGNAMRAGACDSTFGGELLGGYDHECNRTSASARASRDRTVQDPGLRREAIEYSLDHVGQLPLVVFAREGRSWGFFRPSQQVELQATALNIDPAPIWAQTVLAWVLMPLAVVGAVLLRRRGRIIYPLVAFVGIAVFTTAITFGDIRYRAPAEISVALLAAAAVDLLLTAARDRRGPSATATHGPVATTDARLGAVRPGSG